MLFSSGPELAHIRHDCCSYCYFYMWPNSGAQSEKLPALISQYLLITTGICPDVEVLLHGPDSGTLGADVSISRARGRCPCRFVTNSPTLHGPERNGTDGFRTQLLRQATRMFHHTAPDCAAYSDKHLFHYKSEPSDVCSGGEASVRRLRQQV